MPQLISIVVQHQHRFLELDVEIALLLSARAIVFILEHITGLQLGRKLWPVGNLPLHRVPLLGLLDRAVFRVDSHLRLESLLVHSTEREPIPTKHQPRPALARVPHRLVARIKRLQEDDERDERDERAPAQRPSPALSRRLRRQRVSMPAFARRRPHRARRRVQRTPRRRRPRPGHARATAGRVARKMRSTDRPIDRPTVFPARYAFPRRRHLARQKRSRFDATRFS